MPQVKFTGKYDHNWPSRAVTAYPAGFIGSVKKEVAEAAIAAGRAEPYRAPRAESTIVADEADSQ